MEGWGEGGAHTLKFKAQVEDVKHPIFLEGGRGGGGGGGKGCTLKFKAQVEDVKHPIFLEV